MAEGDSQGEGRSIRVLVHEFATGGGLAIEDVPASWLAEGAAMRRAIVADFAAVRGVAVVSTLHFRLPYEPSPAVRMMRVQPVREVEIVLALASHVDYTLIIAPEMDGLLARRAEALAGSRLPSLGSEPAAIALAADKARLGAHLEALGIPTPPCRVLAFEPGWTSPWDGPIVVKPVDGAGAVDTFVIDDPGRWPVEAMAMDQALVQPYLPGEPLSASFLVDADGGATLLAVGRQRIAIEEGRIAYRGGCLPVACDEASLQVVRAAVAAVPGLRGFVGVDFLRDGGRITILEINPRPTTSYVGLARLHPPGTIAGAWLDACRAGLAGTAWPDRLRRPGPGHRVFFSPDGTIESGGNFAVTPPPRTWVALDVGGANLKAAHASGETRTLPFELWKRPERLAEELARLLATLPPADAVALTMTAELCDCFPTKAVGVRAVLEATRSACHGHPLAVWCVDGRFHTPAEADERPALAAASNWLALATVVARMVPESDGLLIDIGSTTTDLIPFADGAVTARGRTDTERLRHGELVYAGARRTPLCALATDVEFRGGPIGVAAELFATTLDVYLTLGPTPEDPAEVATADGRPATVEAARDRLARMIGADRDGFAADDARELARAFDSVLMDLLARGAARALGESSWPPRLVAIAGSGAMLGRRLAAEILAPGGILLDLDEAWGAEESSAGCAHALLKLAIQGDESGAFEDGAWS